MGENHRDILTHIPIAYERSVLALKQRGWTVDLDPEAGGDLEKLHERKRERPALRVAGIPKLLEPKQGAKRANSTSTMEGHQGVVSAVAVTREGTVVSRSDDANVKVRAFTRITFKNDLLCTVRIDYRSEGEMPAFSKKDGHPRILWAIIEPGGTYTAGDVIWTRAFEFLEFTMINSENCGVFAESLEDQAITAIKNNHTTDVCLSLSEILSKEFNEKARRIAVRGAK